MKNKNSRKILLVVLALLIIVSIGYLALRSTGNASILGLNSSSSKDFPLNLDILGKLKLSYSDSWSINNKGVEGLEITKGDVTILLTTVRVENGKSLDQIVDERNELLKSSKKIISDKKVTINNIPFRRLELGSLDESLFPSDGFISYSAMVDNNIYLTMVLNFPSGGNPNEAESLINTIRYN